MSPSRRDVIKWVLYLGAMSALPSISCVADIPRDVLEGVSAVSKKIADLSGYPVAFRTAEDAAFEACMHTMWREANGSTKYIRVFQDLGIKPAYKWQDPETGDWHDQPESYVTLFQYRRP